MRFIHISDLHLGMTPDSGYGWAKQRYEELFDNLDRIVDVCNSEEVDLLLLAGDTFDSGADTSVVNRACQSFLKLSKTRVVIAEGEGERITKEFIDACSWSANVTFLWKQENCKVVFEDINTEIYGKDGLILSEDEVNAKQDVATTDVVEVPEQIVQVDQIEKKKPIRILILYGEQTDNIDRERYTYIALGGNHIYTELDKNMIYSGSCSALDYSEAGIHGYVDIQAVSDGAVPQLVPFSIRDYCNEIINIDADVTEQILMEYFKTVINTRGRDNIFRFNIEGLHNPCEQFTFDGIFAEYNVIAIDDNSIPHYDFDRIYNSNSENVIGLYIRDIKNMELTPEVKEKALHLGVEALLQRWQ